MNYVYDILLNFHEKFYDFYDWNVRDLIDHMRKIPIFKISKNVLDDFLNYDIQIENTFLDKIQDKTELFFGRKIKNISYAFLLTDGKKVVGFKLKDSKLLISDLLLDEEEVALEMVPLLNETKILYSKKNVFHKQNLNTRKEMDLEKKLKQALIYLKNEPNIERLKYIYYECFNQKEEKKEKIIKDLEKKLNEDFTNFSKKLYDLLKLTEYKV